MPIVVARSYDPRALVFISCGQRSEEEKIAQELGKILQGAGYDAYIAKEQMNLRGVREAILPQLADADYLLFVDFRREYVTELGGYRGSLFSHQELAIASFLQIPFIGFRQESVLLEGLSAYLLSNAREFDDPAELPAMLQRELARSQQTEWSPRSRNRLLLTRPDPAEASDMMTPMGRGRFFHLTVKNLHKGKVGMNCGGYVERICDAKTGATVAFRPAELKWAGTTLPWVPIMPGQSRDLDACLILDHSATTVRFVSASDSSEYMAPISGRDLDVTYMILSEAFPPAYCTLRIERGSGARTAKVRQIDPDAPPERR